MRDDMLQCPDCGVVLHVEPIAAESDDGDTHLTVAYSCLEHGAVALADPV